MSSRRLLDLMENINDDLILGALEEHDYSSEQTEPILENESSAKREKTIKRQRTLITILTTALPAACILIILSIGITRYTNLAKTPVYDVQEHNIQTETISEEIAAALGGDNEHYKIVPKPGDAQKIKPDSDISPYKNEVSFVNHDPNNMIAVYTDHADTSECTVRFEVKDEKNYGKFYTYGVYSLYRYNSSKSSYELVPIQNLIEDMPGIISFDKATKKLSFGFENCIGLLSKGDYYITIVIYDSDDSSQSDIYLSTYFKIDSSNEKSPSEN